MSPLESVDPALFNEQDRKQLRAAGLAEEKVLKHLDVFRQGPKYTRLERACTINDGIERLSSAEMESLSVIYAQAAAMGRTMEFVPASGAATRMFKGLLAVRDRADKPSFAALQREAADGKNGADAKECVEWFQGLPRFAFYSDLKNALSRQGIDLEALIAAKDYRPILEALLRAPGLAYADKPKALIPFHRYGIMPVTGMGDMFAEAPARPAEVRTALEEHLAEAARLVRDRHGVCRLHFTVSAEHETEVLAALEAVRGKYEAAGIRFEIGLSRQKPATDTLAADQDNKPYRNADNTLVFRPGGHGALLENLYHTGGDVVFIKNIDNLVPDRLRDEVLSQRRSLGGYLVRLQERIFTYLRRMRENPSIEVIEETAHFIEQRLGTILPEALKKGGDNVSKDRAAYLMKTLDRPLRVCAMVKNQAEPGGGPFWVRYPDGTLRLQIVESSQVESSVSQQRKIVETATHFNPVDLVCGIRNHRGELYKLQDYVDPDAYLITSKSKDGKTLKALELPGLWNGSMAFWNTVFVETPVETFNPVKTVNDLLRASHQG